MESIKINVTGTGISASSAEALTAGMTGLTYEVTYDRAWEGLSKVIVFQAGSITRDAVDGTVPWEVMAAPLKTLRVGIVGRKADGTVVIPTVWADLGTICPAPGETGDPSLEPGNPVWAQTAATARQAMDKASELERTLQAGVQSVNGRTGEVTLTARDVPAAVPAGLPAGTGGNVQAVVDELNARLGGGAFRHLETVEYREPTVLSRDQLQLRAIAFIAESASADFQFDVDVFQEDLPEIRTVFQVRKGCSSYSLLFSLYGKPMQIAADPAAGVSGLSAIRTGSTNMMKGGKIGKMIKYQTRNSIPAGCKISVYGVSV